jgi:hypothetical protein
MKLWISPILAAGALWGGVAWGAAKPSYSLSVPGAPVIRVTTDAAENGWLASNYVASVSASFAVAAPEAPVSEADTPGLPRYTLASMEAGFSVERIKPEVWLGDTIDPPVGMEVDWIETYAVFSTNDDEKASFIFDNIGKAVYVQTGGNLTFTWAATDGTYETRNYIASGSTQGRPYRLFWTDGDWQGPPIDLSGKFVKLYGPSNLTTPEYGDRVDTSGGMLTTQNNVVVYGVFLDRSNSSTTLYAYSGGRTSLSGQFILAYYDSGAFDELKHIQVIEVGQPDIVDMTGYIGEAIQPHGSGHSTDGLRAQPVTDTSATLSEDEYGPYYYQHKGSYSYSPKNNYVFPLRDTTDAPWRLDVYWMEDDAYGVSWPFERCQYSCKWNEDAMPVLVAGDSVKIPSVYSAELVKYQIPNGHANAPQNGRFSVNTPDANELTKVGYSCLKLSANDNVWFLPIRTVDRANTNFFTLVAEDWDVGRELAPRGGSVQGTAGGYAPKIDSSVPGFLNLAESGTHYNPELYYDWTAESNDLESVIYAVNTSPEGKPLEVHWFTSVQRGDMPEKVSIPCLVQRYNIEYPEPDEVPQIVLASQQGGAGESVFQDGSAFYFDSARTTARLPATRSFRDDEGVVSFWANADEAEPGTGRILTLSKVGCSLFLSSNVSRDGVSYSMSVTVDGQTMETATATLAPSSGWHRIVFSRYETNGMVLVDGVLDKTWDTSTTGLDLSGYLVDNVLGAHDGALAPKGLVIDSLMVGARGISEAAAAFSLYEVLSPDKVSMAICLTFDDGDLEPEFGSSERHFTEKISANRCSVTDALRFSPGAPRKGNGVFQADSTPIIYRQPDKALVGYNPNEEHAFIGSGSAGYFAWALRCDLNTSDTSRPGVLAQFVSNGRPAMKYFAVLVTNATYTALAGTATAGTILPGPHPLDMFANPWLPNDYWDDVAGQPVSPAFPDRKNQVWSRCAGTLPIHMYYPNQDGFDFPGATEQPALNDPVPWLSCLEKYSPQAVADGLPAVWTWTIEWPENVENMRIGQTLTTAANGLPEVWNCKSTAVVYPDDGSKTALLWDPTVERRTGDAGFATPADLLKNFGFDPAEGNVTLRGGKYTFKDLPPSVGDRFFVNANLAVANCVCLKGELKTNAGGSILYPNVLNDGEKDAIKALVANSHSKKSDWDRLIDTLPNTPLAPSVLSVTNDKATVAYTPRDHYALTAMGATNYVVLIENDAPTNADGGKMGVQDGDAISMHVFKVLPEYYAGRVVTREDPLNLLSQQLSILYTESLAGKADEFEFEWKKAVPNANGSMPTDYTNVYKDVFAESSWAGLTRFTIGQQGDTLANLVNTYYVMRYRAKKGTTPYAVMQDKWSDWCGPALAEGWIQRCVNNVTPFTQRMRDLYENKAETAASMIAQAGRPWTGDVALNQDNLTEVGLIELYQTLLNKAESMSLTLGLNDTDANKQLLLAAERLCDLYVVLGNEAYADALNPTIGFGTEWPTVAAGTTPVEFGAESTGLFCFDNQVPTLLDEELALLRGRTGANNPAVTMAPFYNRLVWNFTRGITAGEVAYAVNYNINSADNNATMDENDAALQFPQGHGDAWGHYLSAMSVWYRLLRNPYFSWSTSQMQMNVADNVVDVDYYDEERFAETAGKLAKTATDIMDRTAKKAWRDNGGAKGAGYIDDDATRNFGYGEWATRGGIGGVMNWMVANSLLPAAESAGQYNVPTLGADALVYLTNAPVSAAVGQWTFEGCFTFDTASSGIFFEMYGESTDDESFEPANDGDWDESAGRISLSANGDGTCTLWAGIDDFYVVSVTNVEYRTVTNFVYDAEDPTRIIGTNIMDNVRVESEEYELDVSSRQMAEAVFAMPSNGIVAVYCDDGGHLSMFVLDGAGAVVTNVVAGRLPMDSPDVSFVGIGTADTVSEMRFWRGERTPAELHASRAFVNPRDVNLLAYTRGISPTTATNELPDETPGGENPWGVFGVEWRTVAESGLSVVFNDAGLLRINRATAADLETIPDSVSAIQRKLDQLDAGMNPLGLSDNAVPFDISAGTGGDEDKSSHFEQIAERAKKALGNAVKILDRAQTTSTHLRRIQNGQSTEEEEQESSEFDYNTRLIAIYGTPYEDDIGPGGTYPQGYDGPDLYHFMYMDLSLFGVTGAENVKPVSVVTYDTSKGWKYESMKAFLANTANNSSTKSLSYQISANGLVVKPESFTGTRRACGKLQDAYTEYILAWLDFKNAYEAYSEQRDVVDEKIGNIDGLRDAKNIQYNDAKTKFGGIIASETAKIIALDIQHGFQAVAELTDESGKFEGDMSKLGYVGAGLSVVLNPLAPIAAAVGGATMTIGRVFKSLASAAEMVKETCEEAVKLYENAAEWAEARATWNEAKKAAFDEALETIDALASAARDMNAAWAKMVAAAENFDTIVDEGNRIQSEREIVRAKRVNHIIELRYNDMFFRQMQDEALTRYSQAFDLAQKYVYMAAQTYDYETGLLSADRDSGDRFRAEIIGSRALGKFTSDGDPLPASSSRGDPGLADILYRMQANYSVLKGRLGINNPDKNATWFSLRKELFRISSETNALADWQLELSKHVVDDIRAVPEYQRFCQPIASSTPLLVKEPAIVIPFETSIDFAKNFFGKDLAAGDHALDSSYYATKISSAGVKLAGYPQNALGSTPVVYLVPAGMDKMRVPGGGENGTVLYWNVADQVIPVPYAIGSTELDDPDWQPLYTGYTGGVDLMAKIRRIPSFRAIIDGSDSAEPASTRLVGRSAWNTRWVLIIPAGSLLGGNLEDRQKALSIFINGQDTDRDGVTDVPGVDDILLGLKTYATSGN